MTENQRLKEIQKHLGIATQTEFAEILGIKQGSLSDIYREKSGVRVSNSIKRVLERDYSINIDWLETGEGEMLKPSDGLSESVRARLRSESVEPVPADAYTEVPFYDLSATAGLPRGEGSAGWLDTRLVPRQYAGAEFFVVRISGDSMDDGSSRSLCDGDEVVVKFEPVDMANGLPIRTKLFVVDTLEGAVVKQIIELNRSEGYVVLHSFNPLYPDYRVSLSEVLGFYSVQIFTQKRIRF